MSLMVCTIIPNNSSAAHQDMEAEVQEREVTNVRCMLGASLLTLNAEFSLSCQ